LSEPLAVSVKELGEKLGVGGSLPNPMATDGRLPCLRLGRRMHIPSDVDELELDLSKERLIAVTGMDSRGKRVNRHLKVTGKGKLILV